MLAAGCLSACAIFPPVQPAPGNVDWVAFGAMLGEIGETERLALYADARDAHAAQPTGETATRLAILLVHVEEPDFDPGSALSLLDFAVAEVEAGTDLEFIEFFRPIVRRLAAQRAVLDDVAAERDALEAQLDALKELEEQLNADEARP